jgi:predicted CXXCH cytochrome family protein
MDTPRSPLSAARRFGGRRLGLLAALVLAALALAPAGAGAQRKTCVDCHEDFPARLKQKFVHEPVRDGCDGCHKRHGFTQKLVLVKGLPDLCTDCHEGVQHEISGEGVHEALTEGGCTVCHEPHASDVQALMRETEAGAPVCLICHQGLSAAFLADDGHKPFSEGECAKCHAPHASERSALLVKAEDTLCADCHEKTADKHAKIPGVRDFACSDCHDPHGSSKKTPLSVVAHAPFAEGDCESCHDVEDGEVEIGDDFPASDLCADCHDDIADALAAPAGHFGASARATAGTETCLECHDPHGSGRGALLLRTEDALCRGCHETLPDVRRHKGPAHEPFVRGDCSVCHDPHGGVGGEHLVSESGQLCASCHQEIAAPVGGVRHEAMEDADCTDCHSAHTSEYPGLLAETMGATCGDCHDVERHSVTHPPYRTRQCESCHRNHSEQPGLLEASVRETCGECHSEQVRATQAEHPHDPAVDEDCLSCHRPHGGSVPGMLVEAQDVLCFDCHDLDDLVVGASAGDAPAPELHAPVAGADCDGCHDPHGAPLGALLVREGAPLCFGCHVQEKIDFAAGNVHSPVADGACAECHTPHGSSHAGLAATAQPALCVKCHDEPLAGAHAGFDVSAARCTSCHTPHASSLENLLNPIVHEPFADGDCESCHEDAEEEDVGVVVATICFDCHDEKEEETGHQHAEGVSCADCHAPHSSRFAKLLHNPSQMCRDCHADLTAAASGDPVRMHRPVADGSCLECHAMHAPAGERYLASPQAQLCSGCHESIAARAQDATRHEPFAKGECSKCHETHASATSHLLTQGEGELCVSCHDLGEPAMQTAHSTVRPRGGMCSTCHDPHTVAAPNATLVFANRHSPYEDGDCDSCHDDDGSVPASVALCLDCHDGPDDFTNAHDAGREDGVDVAACMDCHSPHAGHDALLARPSQKRTCLQCHDRARFSGKSVHAALDEGCTSCHDPHDSSRAALRGVAGDMLCIGCHEEAAMHAHPIGPQYADPRSGEHMDCVSCHDPHASDHEPLLTFDRQRDLCVQCHAAGTMHAH